MSGAPDGGEAALAAHKEGKPRDKHMHKSREGSRRREKSKDDGLRDDLPPTRASPARTIGFSTPQPREPTPNQGRPVSPLSEPEYLGEVEGSLSDPSLLNYKRDQKGDLMARLKRRVKTGSMLLRGRTDMEAADTIAQAGSSTQEHNASAPQPISSSPTTVNHSELSPDGLKRMTRRISRLSVSIKNLTASRSFSTKKPEVPQAPSDSPSVECRGRTMKHHTNSPEEIMRLAKMMASRKAPDCRVELSEQHRELLKQRLLDELEQEASRAAASESTVPLFGKALEEVTKCNEGWCVPRFFCKMLRHLLQNAITVEGLFRVPGRLDEIMAIKSEIDETSLASCESNSHYAVADTVKLFLRSLPQPLLTSALFQRFLSLTDIADTMEAQEKLRELVLDALPECHRIVLALLMKFLYIFSAFSADNKMTPSNISIVFGPLLLCSENEDIVGMTLSREVIQFAIVQVPCLYSNMATSDDEVQAADGAAEAEVEVEIEAEVEA